MKSSSPRASWVCLCGAALLLIGCESDPPASPPGEDAPSGDAMSGQTGSPGGVECTEHEQCRAGLEAQARSFAEASALRRSFSAARCEPVSLIAGDESRSGPACICTSADGSSLNVGPRGGECQVRGRTGRCLWQSFEGCALEDANSCAQVCADLAQRLNEDAARVNQVELTHYACNGGSCAGVLKVDGRCVPASAVGSGRSYDCALGPEGVLEAEQRHLDAERQAMQPPLPEGGAWQRPDHYENGTLGYVELGVNSESWGSFAREPTFFLGASFFKLEGPDDDAVLGEILDPLSGVDDCGLLRVPVSGAGGFGVGNDYFHIGSAALSIDGQSVPVEPTGANHAQFSSYSADLRGREPRFGASYQFSAQGGELPGPLSLSLPLPEQLIVESLQQVTHLARGALALRWSGKGSAPLRVLLGVGDYQLECRLRDDGSFTLPEALLAQLPDGIASVTFTREARILPKAGVPNVLGWARIQVTHNFAFGATCESEDVARACRELAAKLDAVYAECGSSSRSELGSFCPDYLAQSCGVCTRMYTCQTEQVRCVRPAIYPGSSCGCQVQIGGPNNGGMLVPVPGI